MPHSREFRYPKYLEENLVFEITIYENKSYYYYSSEFENKNKIEQINKSYLKYPHFILYKNGSVLERKNVLLEYCWKETFRSILRGNIFGIFDLLDPLCNVEYSYVKSDKKFDLEFFINGIDDKVNDDDERWYFESQTRLKKAKTVEELFYISWLCEERFLNYNYEIDCEWDENKTLEEDLKEQELILKSIVNQEMEVKDLEFPFILSDAYYVIWIEHEKGDILENMQDLYYYFEIITSDLDLIKIESDEKTKKFKLIKTKKLNWNELRRIILVQLECGIDSRSIEIDLKVAEKELEELNSFEEIGIWIKKLDYY